MTSLRKRYRELLELRIEVAAAELEAFDKPAWQREPHVRFSTQWEREDYAREQRGEKPQGPWVTPRSFSSLEFYAKVKGRPE